MDLSEKLRYEISLWETENDKQICIIGSSEFNSPANIFEPVFTNKLDGPSTLSFSIYAKYYSEEEKEMIVNPIALALHNESKIKLKYYPTIDSEEPEWYTFLIKKVEESSDKCRVNYTATDYYINELSKTGYSLNFDKELENNVGTIEELAEKILEDSSWSLDKENTTTLADERLEGLFWYDNTTIDSEIKKFVFFSSVYDYKNGYQFLTVNGPLKLSNGVITNGEWTKSDVINSAAIGPLSEYKGYFLVHSHDSTYDALLDKYVHKYEGPETNKAYFGFIESEYITNKEIVNYITNGYSITSDSGWVPLNEKSIYVKCIPEASSYEAFVNAEHFDYGLEITENCELFNSGFSDNKKYFKGALDNGKTYHANFKFINSIGQDISSKVTVELQVCNYQYNNGFVKGETILSSVFKGEKEGITFSKSITEKQLSDISNRYGFFIKITKPDEKIFLTRAEFFEEISLIDEVTGAEVMGKPYYSYILNEEEPPQLAKIVNTYYYYSYPKDESGKLQKPDSKEEIEYLYIGEEYCEDYTPIFSTEKKRSITAKESNRFNLLQTLAETFEVWCCLKVRYNSFGQVIAKNVIFKKQIGNYLDTPTIQYGINLKSIKRSIDSNQIATKLIVKSNNNEFAEDGSCNIARATLNPLGENFVYNFDYYINKNLLHKNITNELLSLSNILKPLNLKIQEIISTHSTLKVRLAKCDSDYYNAKVQHDKTEEILIDKKQELYDITKLTYTDFLNKEAENLKKWADNLEVLGLVESIKIKSQERDRYVAEYENSAETKEKIKQTLEELELQLEEKEQESKKAIKDFERYYRSFIQEASWISEDYTDHNLYYVDAESTLYHSAFPKISYTVEALDLGYIPEFRNFHYELADVIMVEDTENFGWAPATGDAFKEEFVITEVKISFETPEKNSITTKNYRTSFQDLFQRFAATTQQLQFHQGEWDKTNKIVDGTQILSESLQDAFANNANILANVANQSVGLDQFGLTAINTSKQAEITRLTSAGIFLTNDGGVTWTTGITPEGINAKVITTGQLNTDNVTVTHGRNTAFRWDKDGLNAYKRSGTGGYSKTDFVRFDSHGIYGVLGNANFQKGLDGYDYDNESGRLEYIKNNSNFSFTQDGIRFGSQTGNNGYLNFDSSNNSLDIQLKELKVVTGVTNGINILKQTAPINKSALRNAWTTGKEANVATTYTDVNDNDKIYHYILGLTDQKATTQIAQNFVTTLGKYYTLSGQYIGGPFVIKFTRLKVLGSNPAVTSITLDKADKLTSFNQTFECTYGTTEKLTISRDSGASGMFQFLKLEEGKKATPWVDSDTTAKFNMLDNQITSQIEDLGGKVGTLAKQTPQGITMAAYGIQPIDSKYPYISDGPPGINNPIAPKEGFKDGDLCVDFKTGYVYEYLGTWLEKKNGSSQMKVNTNYGALQITKSQISSTISGARNILMNSGQSTAIGEGIQYKIDKTVKSDGVYLKDGEQYYISLYTSNINTTSYSLKVYATYKNGTIYEDVDELCSFTLYANSERLNKQLITLNLSNTKIPDHIGVYLYKSNKRVSSDYVTVDWIQLEQGDICTPWSPSASEATYQSEIKQLSESIENTVKNKDTGDGFGWKLTTDGFSLYSLFDGSKPEEKNRVFYCNNTGVTIGDISGGVGSNYLKFSNQGLEVRANKITLEAGQRLNNPNLLYQTSPVGAFAYERTPYEAKNADSIPYNKKIFMETWDARGNRGLIHVVKNSEESVYTQKFGSGSSIKLEVSDVGTGSVDQNCLLEKGQKYTFSGYLLGKGSATLFYRQNGSNEYSAYAKGPVEFATEEPYFYTWTFTVPQGADYQDFFIRIRNDYSFGANEPTYWYHMKLEKGDTATAWEQGLDEPSSSLEIMSNTMVARVGHGEKGFSWQLDENGFYLSTNGTEKNRVFTCDENGIEINGSGTFNGTILATRGKIGAWSFDENGKLSSQDATTKQAMWLNATNSSFWILTSVGDDRMFYVSREGKMYSRSARIGSTSEAGTYLQYDTTDGLKIKGKIEATSGKIAEWNIDGRILYWGTHPGDTTQPQTNVFIIAPTTYGSDKAGTDFIGVRHQGADIFRIFSNGKMYSRSSTNKRRTTITDGAIYIQAENSDGNPVDSVSSITIQSNSNGSEINLGNRCKWSVSGDYVKLNTMCWKEFQQRYTSLQPGFFKDLPVAWIPWQACSDSRNPDPTMQDPRAFLWILGTVASLPTELEIV